MSTRSLYISLVRLLNKSLINYFKGTVKKLKNLKDLRHRPLAAKTAEFLIFGRNSVKNLTVATLRATVKV